MTVKCQKCINCINLNIVTMITIFIYVHFPLIQFEIITEKRQEMLKMCKFELLRHGDHGD